MFPGRAVPSRLPLAPEPTGYAAPGKRRSDLLEDVMCVPQ